MGGGEVNRTVRLDVLQARKLLSRILQHGGLAFTHHARDELEADDLTEPDVVNVPRCGRVSDPPELERGSWRYRVETDRMCAVVTFAGNLEIVVVTVWRKRERGR